MPGVYGFDFLAVGKHAKSFFRALKRARTQRSRTLQFEYVLASELRLVATVRGHGADVLFVCRYARVLQDGR